MMESILWDARTRTYVLRRAQTLMEIIVLVNVLQNVTRPNFYAEEQRNWTVVKIMMFVLRKNWISMESLAQEFVRSYAMIHKL